MIKIKKWLFLSTILIIPLIAITSCQDEKPKLRVIFPTTIATGSNIDFANLRTKNMHSVNYKISNQGQNLIKEFINTDNKNLEKALKLIKENITFSGILVVSHANHSHETVLNNILNSTTYGNFFIGLQTFEDDTIFKKQENTIIFNFKIATSNDLFSFVSIQ